MAPRMWKGHLGAHWPSFVSKAARWHRAAVRALSLAIVHVEGSAEAQERRMRRLQQPSDCCWDPGKLLGTS